MYRNGVHRFVLASATAMLAAGVTAMPAHAVDPPTYQVIASNLDNPRGLSVDGGDVFVAEAGTGGGDGAQCLTNSEGAQVCLGETGAISRVSKDDQGAWSQQRIITGLPSLAAPPSAGATAGGSATGPSDVLVKGHSYAAVIGLGVGCGHPAGPTGPAEPTGPDPTCDPIRDNHLPGELGALVTGRLDSGQPPQVLASIADHEWATNPVSNPDSNPVSVAGDGSGYLVADAGGNTLVHVSSTGDMETIASFPSTDVPTPNDPNAQMPMQFVPTAAAHGPDGAWYVSQLTGFPFPQGGSTIWRVVPGQTPQPYATGLTNVTDLAFAEDGTLYAVELSTLGLTNPAAPAGPPQGALVKIPPLGGAPSTVVDGLTAPYGVAIDGTDAFVTTGSVLPGGGAVIRIPITVNPLLGSLGSLGPLGSLGSAGSSGS